jgi:hypothetical protein
MRDDAAWQAAANFHAAGQFSPRMMKYIFAALKERPPLCHFRG